MSIRTKEAIQPFLTREVAPIIREVVQGYDYDPGDSDLDDEQPITVRMTLGEYRRARRVLFELRLK